MSRVVGRGGSRGDGALMRTLQVVARPNWALVAVVVVLGVIGVYNLQSTSTAAGTGIYLRQTWFLLVGVAVMAGVAAVDYRHLERHAPIFYAGMVLLLALVLVVGKEVNGSRRWFEIAGLGFQPSEPTKLAVILTLAALFNRQTRPGGYTLRDLVPIAAILVVPCFLILQEPDLGHTLMLVFIAFSMLTFERFERRTLMTLVVSAVIAVPVSWALVLRDYQKDRILTLLDGQADRLGSGWHAEQARTAVGSGQLLGKGHGEGTQVAGGFLPENHTDFVFANFSEEHGFVGAAVVVLLYLALVLIMLRVAATARDKFGTHVAIGVAALVFWQVVMNMGMVLSILPVTGVTLPLMSYGGTSVLTVLTGVGLVLNVSMRRMVF